MRSAFRVIRTVREKHACTQCDAIVQAPAPSRPIERGIAGPGLLARVLTSKYAEHTPLYRQSEIYGRQGVELSRSLLSGWVDACCRQLSPLEEALHGYVLTDGKLHADDTPVPVLLPGNKKTKTGRLWTYVRDDRNAGSTLAPAVWFAYSPDRKGIHPQTHLAGFSGVLQADAYAGFNELYRDGRITEAACWAHARRKIHDVHVRTPSALTEEALKRIGELYAIEAEIRGMTAEQRLAERQLKTKPLLKSLESWLREKMKTLSRHSELAKAFAYALNQWPALTYYADDGWAEADNNIAENALRMVSLGRKNSYSINDNTNSYVNSGKARLHGVEFAGTLPLWSEDVTLSLNYTWTRSEQRDGDNKGAPLSYTPEHMVNAKLNWQITEEVASWLGARYRGKTPRFTQNYSSLSAVQKKVYDEKGEYLKAWTVVDAGLSWKMTDALTLNAAVNNLLNKDYSDVSLYSAGKSTLYAGDYFQTGSSTTGYVIPERNYWMSLNYQF